MLFVCSDRQSELKVDFFNLKWNRLPFSRKYPKSEKSIRRPENLEAMIGLSEKLARPFPFVRVDFYEIDSRVFFGELTFYPGNGVEPFSPVEWDHKLGSMLSLPAKQSA